MAMWPGSVCERRLVEGVGDLAHRARDAQLLAVGGGDAGALLSAMLERVEAEVGEIRRFGVTEDAEDTALVFEFVQHRSGPSILRRSPARSSVSSARRPEHARLPQRDNRSPRRRHRHRDSRIRLSCRSPAPARRARAPAAAAPPGRSLADTTDARRRFAEERRATPDDAASTPARSTSSRCRRCRSALGKRDRQAAVRAVVRRLQQSRGAACVSRAISARSASRSSAGGVPRTRPCIDLQVFAAAELAEALAEQDDRVARLLERPSTRTRRRVLDQPDHADDRRRIDRAGRRSRCRG